MEALLAIDEEPLLVQKDKGKTMVHTLYVHQYAKGFF